MKSESLPYSPQDQSEKQGILLTFGLYFLNSIPGAECLFEEFILEFRLFYCFLETTRLMSACTYLETFSFWLICLISSILSLMRSVSVRSLANYLLY